MGKPALHQLHWCIQEATWRHPLDLQLRASLLGGIQGTAREDGEDCTECFCPKGRERGGGRNPRWRRLDKHSRPHASFNKGISEQGGERKKKKEKAVKFSSTHTRKNTIESRIGSHFHNMTMQWSPSHHITAERNSGGLCSNLPLRVGLSPALASKNSKDRDSITTLGVYLVLYYPPSTKYFLIPWKKGVLP